MLKKSVGEALFQRFNYIVLLAVSLTMFLPLVHVASISLSSPFQVEGRHVSFWPVDFTLASYKVILAKVDLWRALGVNVFVTAAGTLFSMWITVMLAYSLSRTEFLIRKYVMLGIVFTMIFQPPMIPYFLTIKGLGMLDSIWALIIPSGISAFNLIIVRTFFQQLPKEIGEAAKMDGCHDARTLISIVLPLSKPVLATVGLFYAVMYWNIFYHALLFIQNPKLYPLQIKIREYIVNQDTIMGSVPNVVLPYNPETLQAAVIMFSALPIILVYPYLQKYFIQGATLGSVKE
ncbi:carbohydrate ABC transporter permease [Paenibacillus koleovorans]|uniref:carbohydrate ABC transporter permease n=1 Tax=Paenibacillus koleovorans TaxID=121608 RepID=UPI0027D92D8B|nr:carbohydrate ABC transporter permease [Paenibacillus koleovorans]